MAPEAMLREWRLEKKGARTAKGFQSLHAGNLIRGRAPRLRVSGAAHFWPVFKKIPRVTSLAGHFPLVSGFGRDEDACGSCPVSKGVAGEHTGTGRGV